MHHVEFSYTTGMDDAELESSLERSQTGVLSLADEGDAYAVPVAHFYDGEHLYFRLGRTPDSRKWEAIAATDTATYVLFGREETAAARDLESWSVLVRGALRELPPEEAERFDAATINEHFPAIRVFDEAIEDVEVVILELAIESATGRETLEA
jgi:nitroimidazol reductase NimA-like FMN-containing flavoprotein (pyridoxamine 5'-phosphate oxidase superfamily)